MTDALISALELAPDGSVCDVWGYDAVKRCGLWHVDETDDEIGQVERHDMTAADLLPLMCCDHSAHFPVSPPGTTALI